MERVEVVRLQTCAHSTKYYHSHRDIVRKKALLLRIQEGHKPKKSTMEKYDIPQDEPEEKP